MSQLSTHEDRVMEAERLRDAIIDVDRLAEIEAAGLADSMPEEAFDRITRLAERLLDVPVALISIVSRDRQLFKSQVGLSGTWEADRESPLTHSFCQYVVADESRFVVDDARAHSRVRDNPAVEQGVAAYAGEPLRTASGHVLGAMCVIDHEPREWQDSELELLQELAALAMNEIEYRLRTRGLRELEMAAHGLEEPLAELGGTVRSVSSLADSVEDHRIARLASLARARVGELEAAVSRLRQALATASPRSDAVYLPVQFGQPLMRAARIAMASVPDKAIKVEALDRPLTISCDPYEVERGLSEVLITFMHHAGHDEPVTVTASRNGNSVRLTIDSTGRAMPAAELGRVAARLHQITSGPEGPKVGESSITTLGRITAVCHGNVVAETSVRGTTVILDVPAVEAADVGWRERVS